MKRKLWITIALCVYLCMSMAACGEQQSEETAPADDSAWQAAYLETLQADEDAILPYERNGEAGLVALSDLNGDDTPELLYFVMDEATEFPAMKIYTFRDGTAQEVSYEKPLACTEYSDLPADALYDYQLQGGSDYQVFLNGDGTLVMYSLLYGAESNPGMVNEYRMNADGNLEEICRFGFVDGDTTATFWKDGMEISREEYLSLCDEAVSDVNELIFCQKRTTVGYNHDAKLWDATDGMDYAGMSYDQAVAELGE